MADFKNSLAPTAIFAFLCRFDIVFLTKAEAVRCASTGGGYVSGESHLVSGPKEWVLVPALWQKQQEVLYFDYLVFSLDLLEKSGKHFRGVN